MKVFNFEEKLYGFDVTIDSDDRGIANFGISSLEFHLKQLVSEMLLGEMRWREYIRAWSRRYQLPESIRMLSAHGGPVGEQEQWHYFDGSKMVEPVQRWVSRYDGKHVLLIVGCCGWLERPELTVQSSLCLASCDIIMIGPMASEPLGDSLNVITPLGMQSSMTLEFDTAELQKEISLPNE